MTINRRTVLQHTAAGFTLMSGVFGSAFRASSAKAQSATLMAMVFLSKRLDASTEQYRRWYIDYHAPDFLEFGARFLTRYTQDFVEKGHLGPVDFDAISEFGYIKSRPPQGVVSRCRIPRGAKDSRPSSAHRRQAWPQRSARRPAPLFHRRAIGGRRPAGL